MNELFSTMASFRQAVESQMSWINNNLFIFMILFSFSIQLKPNSAGIDFSRQRGD